jgi:hypothetical protein
MYGDAAMGVLKQTAFQLCSLAEAEMLYWELQLSVMEITNEE